MKLYALQYLRAVAAIAVVYSHIAIQVDSYGQYLAHVGSFGVDIFFVISGFIMVYISRPSDTPLAFMVNRIRRVVPLYWFFTILMACILLIMPSVFKATIFEWETFLLSLGFIPHWSVAHEGFVWPIVAPGWSLVFEMYFYAVFALSLLLADRFRLPFMVLLISTIFMLAAMINTGESAVIQFFSESMVFEFVFGMLLAVAWKRGITLPSNTCWCLLVLSFSILLLDLSGPRIFTYGIASFFIVTACLFIKVKQYNWAVLLGDSSYSLYLSHIFTLGILRKFLPPLLGEGQSSAYLFVALSMFICIVVGIYTHKIVDNWLLRHERLQFPYYRTLPSKEA